MVRLFVNYCFKIYRPYWLKLIKNAWDIRPLIWLSGVRRGGKKEIVKRPKVYGFNTGFVTLEEEGTLNPDQRMPIFL